MNHREEVSKHVLKMQTSLPFIGQAFGALFSYKIRPPHVEITLLVNELLLRPL